MQKHCRKCNASIPNKIKVDGAIKALSNRRKFCLECSPFGLHNTKDLSNIVIDNNSKKCPKCDEIKSSSEFYKRKRSSRKECSPYCIKCTNQQTTERQRRFKQSCIDYKGGKCQKCGYNSCNTALEFHHADPSKKDFSIASSKLTKFDDRIKTELDKCSLLCANCHREEHEKCYRKDLNPHKSD